MLKRCGDDRMNRAFPFLLLYYFYAVPSNCRITAKDSPDRHLSGKHQKPVYAASRLQRTFAAEGTVFRTPRTIFLYGVRFFSESAERRCMHLPAKQNMLCLRDVFFYPVTECITRKTRHRSSWLTSCIFLLPFMLYK